MKEMKSYPCVIMRAGTSKGVFFHSEDLPADAQQRDEVILKAMGSGDPREIDGLGGADILTSKIAIIGPPTRADADVDYTFGQAAIEERYVNYSPNCGNISTGVGVFAIQEGLVKATDPLTTVLIHNTNTKTLLKSYVPTVDGMPRVAGDLQIGGVPGTGAEIRLDFSQTVGGTTGKLLPTGSPVDDLWITELNRTVPVSIVDVGNVAVFFPATEIGLTGNEMPDQFTDEILIMFAYIQRAAAERANVDPTHGFPRPIAVAKPQSFRNFMTGEMVDESEVDLLGRRVHLPPPRLHKAFAGTGAVCTGVAARLSGTVVNAVARPTHDPLVRLGHPTGIFPIRIDVIDRQVNEASMSRTARRIMDGSVYVRF